MKPKPPAFLQQFCHPPEPAEEMRYPGMVAPWAVGSGWRATDGRILIGHRRAKLKAQEPAGAVPLVEDLLPNPKKGRWRKWPADPPTSPCLDCSGDGQDCFACGGTGKALYQVNGAWIARRYFLAIRSLPNACCLWRKRPSNARNPVQFRYKGGVGAVMPVVRGGQGNAP